MKIFLSIAALIALDPCSGGGAGDDSGNDAATLNPGETPTCSVTLSGAVTGTYDCRPASVVWSAANNTGGFAFSVQSAGIVVAIGWLGEPTGGVHYKNSDASSTGGVTVTTGSGAATQAWAATAANGSDPAQGTVDLYFADVSADFTTSSGKPYTTDGTITATLVPLTGQSGSVTVSVTF